MLKLRVNVLGNKKNKLLLRALGASGYKDEHEQQDEDGEAQGDNDEIGLGSLWFSNQLIKENQRVLEAKTIAEQQRTIAEKNAQEATKARLAIEGSITRLERSANALCFSPGGNFLVYGGNNNTVIIRDRKTKKIRHRLRGQQCEYVALAYSPDGTKLTSAGEDRSLRLWEAASGKLISVLKGHARSAQALAFSPDGQKIASGSDDKTVRIWDAHSGEVLQVLRGHKLNVSSVDFSTDGRHLVSGSWDGTLRIWDLDTAKTIREIKTEPLIPGFPMSKPKIKSVKYSPDGKTILSGLYGKDTSLWEAHTGKLIRKLSSVLRLWLTRAFPEALIRIMPACHSSTNMTNRRLE